MKIKQLCISGSGTRSIDSPIRFPSACQPSLLTAPTVRITIKDSENHDTEVEHYAQIEDQKKSVNFGNRGCL